MLLPGSRGSPKAAYPASSTHACGSCMVSSATVCLGNLSLAVGSSGVSCHVGLIHLSPSVNKTLL